MHLQWTFWPLLPSFFFLFWLPATDAFWFKTWLDGRNTFLTYVLSDWSRKKVTISTLRLIGWWSRQFSMRFYGTAPEQKALCAAFTDCDTETSFSDTSVCNYVRDYLISCVAAELFSVPVSVQSFTAGVRLTGWCAVMKSDRSDWARLAGVLALTLTCSSLNCRLAVVCLLVRDCVACHSQNSHRKSWDLLYFTLKLKKSGGRVDSTSGLTG